MLRMILVSAVAAVPFTLAAMPVLPPVACTNVIPHEPLVVYDNSGGTIAGLIDVGLTVYNDGWVRASVVSQVTNTTKAEVAYVGPQLAGAFALDLRQLGAGVLCDQVSFANDLPTQTLTILSNNQDPRGHTYSWLEGDASYAPIDQRIQTFLHATFPNL